MSLLLLGAGFAIAEESKPPAEQEYSYQWDLLDHSLVRPTTRALDPALLVRRLTGNPREAANVDENDDVRLPSTWWQPRLGFRPVTVDQILQGPGPGEGPRGRWTITRAKTQGITPGFQIKDANGDRFLIKFDSAAFPELATSLDVVGSCLFWGAGYNVPENTIAFFHPDSVRIAEDATYTDRSGHQRPFKRERLSELVENVARLPDGRYRVSASRFIEGKPLGPFKYYGRRSDDAEDLIPHEHRRELRGLWTIAAWLNHCDSRGPNSHDAWVTENGHSFVRHHLIDFSAILGSGALAPRSAAAGTEYYVDAPLMLRRLSRLGLVPFSWESAVDPNIPSAGFVSTSTFDPIKWRPDYPNPAFDERTLRDIRWGARIVAAFTDEHIRAAVQAGRYSDPRAVEFLTQALISRRDKIVRAFLALEE